MGATYKLKHKKTDGTIEEVTVPISTVDGLQTALDGKLTSVKVGSTSYSPTNGVVSLPSYVPLAGGNMNDGATLKFSLYGNRFVTIGGNSITADMSQTSGGWAGTFAGVKHKDSSTESGTKTTTMLGWYGGDSGLTHIFMGGTYSDPAMKMTPAGQFTFKNAPKVGTTSVALATNATQSQAGLMSADDKKKLDGIGESSSAELIIVTFTSSGNNNYTVDLTYDDIEQAFADGKIIVGVDSTNSYIYQIFGLCDDDTIPFSRIVNWGAGGAVVETLFVNTDDSVSYARNALATTELATATSKGLMSAGDKKKVDWLDLDTSDGYIFTIGDDSVTSARIELNNNDNSVNAIGEEVYLRSTFGGVSITSEDSIYLQADGDIMANGKKVCTANMSVPFIPSDAFTVVAGGNYKPTKWSVANVGGITNPTDGMTIAVRIPNDGSAYGIFLSINGGSNYYPIVQNKNTVVSSHYQRGSTLILTFNATQTVSVYSGSSTQTTVTGCWQIADYDRDNTVNQYHTTTNSDYPLLFKYDIGTSSSSNPISYTRFSNNIYVNPSTGTIYANDFVVDGQSIVGGGGGSSSGGEADTFVVHFNYDGQGNLVADQSFDEIYSKIQDGKMPFADFWGKSLSCYYNYGHEIGFRSIEPYAGSGVGGDYSFINIHYIIINSDGYVYDWWEDIEIPSGSQGSGAGQQSVTYAQLKKLRDDGKLVAGMQYRITDFVTTTSQPDTQSAGHPFNIIVTALSNTTLSENASADLPATSIANADGSLAEGSVQPYYYVFEDFNDATGPTEGYKAGDIFVAYDYLENNDGVVVPVLYKNEVEAYGEEGPDYQDKFYYEGTMEVDGVTYDKWRKICEDGDGPYWDGSTGSIWALTNIIVQDGQIGGSAVDPHFANSNLPAWEIKYCLDNDKTRFAWACGDEQMIVNLDSGYSNGRPLTRQPTADGNYDDNDDPVYEGYHYAWGTQEDVDDGDTTNFWYSQNEVLTNGETVIDGFGQLATVEIGNGGKGVIYYMKDEWGNECPYDFKNIQFKRYKVTEATNEALQSFVYDENIGQYCYYGIEDAIDGVTIDLDDFIWCYTFMGYPMNVDTGERGEWQDGSLESPYGHQSDEAISTFMLNRIQPYISYFDIENEDYTKCGVQKLNNIVLYGSWDKVGSSTADYPYYYANCCCYNEIGYGCYSITLGEENWYNTFSQNCYNIVLGSGCKNISFNGNCSRNTLGNHCFSVTFDTNCQNNQFTSFCSDIKLMFYCVGITLLERTMSAIFEAGVSWVSLRGASNVHNIDLQNIIVSQGIKGEPSDLKILTVEQGADYQQIFRKSGSQEILVD